jgi:hypothetical protein
LTPLSSQYGFVLLVQNFPTTVKKILVLGFFVKKKMLKYATPQLWVMIGYGVILFSRSVPVFIGTDSA